ncbi:Pentatricopeptide repeat-containing protein At1g56690, mitochondrial [Linum perenne]
MLFRFIPRRHYSAALTPLASNSQITHFARTCQIDKARQVFDQLRCKTVVSWNAIVAAYFNNNQPREARKLFDHMPDRNVVSWNGLISGYVKNGMTLEARKAFDKMPERNVVSWTAMIRGYVQEGMVEEAEILFKEMPEKNVVSWTVMIGGLIESGRIDEAAKLYDAMPVKDVVARTNMIGGFCAEGRLKDAREIFDEMPERNVIAWTTMINGYAMHNKVDVARKLFEVMPDKNEVTWTAMLMGYTRGGRIKEAAELFDSMPDQSAPACNEMIMGFGRDGEVSKARRVFDEMRQRDDVSWSAMIKVYERQGFELEALGLFRFMQLRGIRPNFPSMISILSVCGSLAILDHGREVHAQLVRSLFDFDVYVCSVLITMYIKCGDLVKGKRVFDRFASKDTVMWNSIITGYAQHGLGNEALQVFYDMLSSGVAPDEVTFVGVLSACSYTGRVKEGLELFDLMKSKYLVIPKTEHYSCVVDLLGRAGKLNEAMNLIQNMSVEADAVVWGALLGACRIHNRLDMAEVAAKKLLLLEPENSGHYILLSNIYSSQGKWKDVASLRSNMRLQTLSKSPGCSWIQVEKEVHMFTGGDSTSHPDHPDILRMLEKLDRLIREAGYLADGSFVLHDVEEEEKVHSLRYHSEKLAVAYGILKVPKGTSIRIMKNLRVCGDCHTAIKLIAKVTDREIILRDANRFHHFKDGSCSCGDYW